MELVTFSYTTSTNSTPVNLTTASLVNGAAVAAIDLPVGTDYVTGTYAANGSFGGSVSAAMTITVNAPTIIGRSNSPIALPYTMTTIAGGASSNCSAAADKYGNGCAGTSIAFTSGDDLRSVVADPFGNVYLTDASASHVRRISPDGVITNFAGSCPGLRACQRQPQARAPRRRS